MPRRTGEPRPGSGEQIDAGSFSAPGWIAIPSNGTLGRRARMELPDSSASGVTPLPGVSGVG